MTFTQWKNRRRRRAAIVALAVCTTAGMLGTTVASAETTASEGAVAAPAVYHLMKRNFGIAPGAGFFLDDAHLTAGLNDARTLGVHWIRSTIPWQNFQPYDPLHLPRGVPQYNWKSVDRFIAQVHQPQYVGRFAFIVTLDTPPAWAKVSARIGRISCPTQAPFDLASYARAAAALASHLRATAHVFEVENSPNIGRRGPTHDNPIATWPVPNPCGYARLLKLTTPAVHALKVGATVLVGGIGGVQDIPGQRISADRFLAGLYANGARGAFDGVSFHPYSTPFLPCAPTAPVCVFNPHTSKTDRYGMKNGWDRMLNARRIMVNNGDALKRIWITEYGGPTSGPSGSIQVLSEAGQSALLVAGFQRASQYPWVAMMAWFTYIDDGGNPQSSPNGAWMGLLRANRSRKPAFATYQRLTLLAH